MTLEHLMETSSEEQLTLFAGDSHASRSVLPGSEQARTMTATSGRKCYESFGRFSRVTSLAKMLLVSSRWNSTVAYLTWKQSVTPAGRLLFRLVPSMPSTDETEYGFLPTATATANQAAPSMQKHAGCRRLTGGGRIHANANSASEQGRGLSSGVHAQDADSDSGSDQSGRSTPCKWKPEPGMGRVVNGIPRRMDRLRSLGNAVVPQVVEQIGLAIMGEQ